MATPKIAIIGNGNVGSSLRKGAEKAGYEVRTTGSDPAEVRSAAAWGDLIILAVPSPARRDAVGNLGAVDGKVLVDPTNLLDESFGYTGSLEKSGAEEVQEWASGARVVKAFNTVFAQNMAAGEVQGEPLSLLVAGDDAEAKRQVLDLGAAIGFQPVDVGPLTQARYLEALGFLNIQLGYGPTEYGTDLGFRIVGLG